MLLVVAELIYFKVADYFNIIDKPNERSSHSTIVLRGGGIIFAISILVWMALQMVNGEWLMVKDYLPSIVGLVLICGVSFWDDVKSLPDSVRLVAQFTAMALMFWSMGIMHWDLWWFVIIALIVIAIVLANKRNKKNDDGVNEPKFDLNAEQQAMEEAGEIDDEDGM